MERVYQIIDQEGLHARPASLLVEAASKFPNEILLTYQDRKVSLKSILGVMSLGVKQNGLIKVEVNGENKTAVFQALEKLLKAYNLVAN